MSLIKIIITTILCVYGISILLPESNNIVKDIDGNVYNIVTIGNQEWMIENLRTTRLNNGEDIPFVTDDIDWNNSSKPAFSWYENDYTYKEKYGALYNWYTIETGKICPEGWHVPSHSDWSELTNALDGIDLHGSTILMNGELKATNSTPNEHPRWDRPNTGATNTSGFTALPGGHRNHLGPFNYLGKLGFWWTSTESTYTDYAFYRGMRYDNSNVFMTDGNKKNGFSVRCQRS